MKQLLAATLLVAVFAVTSCGEAKKPAPKTDAPAATTTPAAPAKPAEPAKTP